MKDFSKKFKKFLKVLKTAILKYKKQFIFTIVMTVILLILIFYEEEKPAKEIKYTEFLTMVESGEVTKLYYSIDNEYMIAVLDTPEVEQIDKEFADKNTENETSEVPKTKDYPLSSKRRVLYPATENFREEMLKSDVEILLNNETTIIDLLSSGISLLLPVLYILLILRVVGGSQFSISTSDLLQESDIKFSDVIGHDEILDDIKFITELIKTPDFGMEIGAKVPKGVLLSGVPGTGKTLIAKAISGEAGVPFLYINASSFVEMYVGLGAKRVRELFKFARKNSPCIIFIDEIDAIGTKRSSHGSNSENDQTINALLTEMDGFSPRDGIFIIAATNRADMLDKALTRTGRFDRQIVIHPPRDYSIRKKLFEHYLKKYTVVDNLSIDSISKQTVGFTGSDIATICNEAGIIATMHKKTAIDDACIEEAIDKHVFKGNRSKAKKHDEDRTIVAYHEAGHAVMTWLCGESIARASIISNTAGVGGAVFGEDRISSFSTKRFIENRIKICYAGRASEQLKFDDVTTGASNDIEQATNLLRQYVEVYGFSDDVGMLSVQELDKHGVKVGVSEAIQSLSKSLYFDTLDVLRKNYAKIELLANALLKYETLNGDSILEILNEEVNNASS